MKKMTLQATTLNEILIVMILTGLLTFVVFEGLSLYQRMYKYATWHNNHSENLYDNYLRIQSLFVGADSICDVNGQLNIYKRNEMTGTLWMADSLLLFKPKNEIFIDTLLNEISECNLKVDDGGYKRRIDSLILRRGQLILKFGLDWGAERLALVTNMKLEKKLENNEN